MTSLQVVTFNNTIFVKKPAFKHLLNVINKAFCGFFEIFVIVLKNKTFENFI